MASSEVAPSAGARVVKAEVFEGQRAALLGLAWRMLGSLTEAEDVVQEAWLRFDRAADVQAPGAWLVRVVSRLCLDHLKSARIRREVPAGDRLPQPVVTPADADLADTVSIAFLMVLQRLSPPERAAFLLHEVFDLPHGRIAEILGRPAAGCRQLLRRARQRMAEERNRFSATAEEHRQLLRSFAVASRTGDLDALVSLLAPDAVLVSDGGASGARFGRIRNLRRPVEGAVPIARFMTAVSAHGPSEAVVEELRINGRAALVVHRPDQPPAVMQIAAGGGRIHRVYLIASGPLAVWD